MISIKIGRKSKFIYKQTVSINKKGLEQLREGILNFEKSSYLIVVD